MYKRMQAMYNLSHENKPRNNGACIIIYDKFF